jgi:hypothetical protein
MLHAVGWANRCSPKQREIDELVRLLRKFAEDIEIQASGTGT